MTDEENKAIEVIKGLSVYYDDYGLLDEEEIEENEEVNNSINIVINLIEKQQKELAKKDKIIDKMAEQLAGLTICNNDIEEALILRDKQEVKDYFTNLVEKENK